MPHEKLYDLAQEADVAVHQIKKELGLIDEHLCLWERCTNLHVNEVKIPKERAQIYEKASLIKNDNEGFLQLTRIGKKFLKS